MTTKTDSLSLTRLNIPKQWDMLKATSKQDPRFATGIVSLKDGKLTATNGRIAVQHRVDFDLGVDLQLDETVWKAARKAGNLQSDGAIIHCGDAQYLSTHKGEFPNVDHVIPESKESNVKIALNATLLKKLADALGAGGDSAADRVVYLDIEAPNKPVRVTCQAFPDSIGVIMPLMIKD
jgi:hypothetical protein